MTTPAKLKAFRKRHKMSQSDAAKAFGYKTFMAISLMERGERKISDQTHLIMRYIDRFGLLELPPK